MMKVPSNHNPHFLTLRFLRIFTLGTVCTISHIPRIFKHDAFCAFFHIQRILRNSHTQPITRTFAPGAPRAFYTQRIP